MNKFYILFLMCIFHYNYGQSLIQNTNSSNLITSRHSISVGEIVVVPQSLQSNSGTIGILAQLNAQLLEVTEFEISENLIVYPNPTENMLFFKATENLMNEKLLIFDSLGKLIKIKTLKLDNQIDMSDLAKGIYLVNFESNTKKSFKIIKN